MIQAFTATPRSLILNYGSITIFNVSLSIARLGAMVLALVLTGLLYWLLRHSQMGRAIIAVRMDHYAARLLGIRVEHIYAITFGIGALMAAAAGAAMAVVFPITPLLSGVFLGKAFVTACLAVPAACGRAGWRPGAGPLESWRGLSRPQWRGFRRLR
jgi:branched-chain amino acid transport system permease protein